MSQSQHSLVLAAGFVLNPIVQVSRVCKSFAKLKMFTKFSSLKAREIGGESGIRTHGTLARTTVFETAPFDHSGTSPQSLGFHCSLSGP